MHVGNTALPGNNRRLPTSNNNDTGGGEHFEPVKTPSALSSDNFCPGLWMNCFWLAALWIYWEKHLPQKVSFCLLNATIKYIRTQCGCFFSPCYFCINGYGESNAATSKNLL